MIAIETMQTNVLAPLELTVSFYATLVGSSGVKFLDKSSKRRGDVEPGRGASPIVSPPCGGGSRSERRRRTVDGTTATATLQHVWKTRVDKGDVDGGEPGAVSRRSWRAPPTLLNLCPSMTSTTGITGAVPEMFAWFVMHAESGKGVDVDVA